jgi:hypothetical protein
MNDFPFLFSGKEGNLMTNRHPGESRIGVRDRRGVQKDFDRLTFAGFRHSPE